MNIKETLALRMKEMEGVENTDLETSVEEKQLCQILYHETTRMDANCSG
jgi:hypothetical protein